MLLKSLYIYLKMLIKCTHQVPDKRHATQISPDSCEDKADYVQDVIGQTQLCSFAPVFPSGCTNIFSLHERNDYNIYTTTPETKIEKQTAFVFPTVELTMHNILYDYGAGFNCNRLRVAHH